MAITTLNGALAGMQPMWPFVKTTPGTTVSGRLYSYWSIGGNPSAGTFNSTLNGGTYSSSSGLVTGQIPHYDPVSGNSYLSRFQAQPSAGPGLLLLCDRLWDNGGITITSTTAQSITSPTWPARDNNGATLGAGVHIACEVSAATGAGNPTITVGYTNSAGTSGRTAINIEATGGSSAQGTFYRIAEQAGDIGIQSVQSLTLSATWTSGTINLVAYRVIAALELPNTGASYAIDAFTAGMPQIFNGTVPFLVYLVGSATASVITGQYGETQG